MNILIIGFGKMGESHFNSFLSSRKKYNFYIVDKKFKKNYKKKNQNKLINFSKRIPKKKLIHLAIVATSSFERFKVIKNITDNNKIKYMILEKFLFNESDHYKKTNIIAKQKKIKIMVNVWGRLILKPILNKLNNKKISRIEIIGKKGEQLSNLIHYYDFINSLLKKSFSLKIKKNLKVYKSKRKGYDEIDAELNSKKPNILIKTKKSIK